MAWTHEFRFGHADSTVATYASSRDRFYGSLEHTYGKRSSGETRTASNKRNRETVVPIGDELECELVRC